MSRKNQLSLVATACVLAAWGSAAQARDVDAIMGNGLRELVQQNDAASPNLAGHMKAMLSSDLGEPLVRLHLDPSVDSQQALARLAAAGFKVTAVSQLDASHVEGYLPLGSARAVANLDFVRSLAAERVPTKAAGSVQSQAVAFEKAGIAHTHGYSGQGIRIGALSDSFDACAPLKCSTDAAKDISTGDLPKKGVTVLQDMKPGTGTDEGRAMLQLVHDIAPQSHLAFATAFLGEVKFANFILDLKKKFGADVITDDVSYSDEPFYSDGIVAQAVDQVSAQGVAYFSSAGNNGQEAYEGVYQPVPFAQAVKKEPGNLHLEQIPANLRPVSVHLFNGHTVKGDVASLSEPVTVGGQSGSAGIDLQWDEPFYLGKVKTDYNIYVFDQKGNWIAPDSQYVQYTTDDNIQTDAPNEYATLDVDNTVQGGDTYYNNYQIVIGKMNSGGADHIKFIAVNTLAEFQFLGAPSVYGHNAAAGGQAVGAVYWDIPEFPEDFSSPGPVTIYTDTAGNRLPNPEVRNVPQIAGADGVDTTFFSAGNDPDGSGHPDFFGTSAAAPDVAAVAALVLEAAGGGGSLTPAQTYAALQNTAHHIPVANIRYRGRAKAGDVTLNLHGDWDRWNEYWEFTLDKAATGPVAQIDMDATDTLGGGLQWNPAATRFYLGQTNGIKTEDIVYSVSADAKTATLKFNTGTFIPGGVFHFGTSLYNAKQGVATETPDRFQNLKVTVTMEDGTQTSGVVTTQAPRAINRYVGAGLVDAAAATKLVTGK